MLVALFVGWTRRLGGFYFYQVFKVPQALNNLLTQHLSVMKYILVVPVP